MASVPKRTADRIVAGIKRFQPITAAAKARDVNESDTVIIVTDMLADVFGYEKYSEITSEHAVKSTFCDLAVKLDGVAQPRMLLEVKAIGLDLKDQYIKQAVDYAANLGVDWVVLTNAECWKIYKVIFGKPIDAELVLEFAVSKLDPKSEASIDALFTISKEGWQKSALAELQERKQALNRYFLGAILLSDSVLDVIRRELRRLSPNVKIEEEEIKSVLLQEVLKREVLEGDKAELARKQASRASSRPLRSRSKKDDDEAPDTIPVPAATDDGESLAQSSA
ncbi:MAG TPA: type I restriction enzyme HsdR N-terminal domain-containing protein [Pirellulales bacterium]|jgi:predicted type IV restriction endonuclease|nr:type I restriction enzyme HsdR N-terminal domain-containing protein [Pirellulales bacterium]